MRESSVLGRRSARRSTRGARQGFTLIEIIITLAVIGIVLAIAALNLRGFHDPLHEAATDLSGLMKQSRAKAMATTSAYRVLVSPSGSQHLITEAAISCDTASTGWTADSALTTDLPAHITMTVTQGSLPTCFDPRGIASEDVIFKLTDGNGRTMSVEVMLGGAVRILS
jgi:prepilin-type N-terminal cleavage/methylation domain-containing protein